MIELTLDNAANEAKKLVSEAKGDGDITYLLLLIKLNILHTKIAFSLLIGYCTYYLDDAESIIFLTRIETYTENKGGKNEQE